VSELRIDPLTGQRAIVAGPRAPALGAPARGAQLRADPAEPVSREADPFLDGHEDRTPPELFALRPQGGAADTPGWQVRVLPSLDPALRPDSEAPAPQANRDLFWADAARGCHEVIINAPDPVVSLGELSAEQVATALEVWRERMRVHAQAACVHVIVNERREAGASPPHTHAELYALGFVPAAIARERERFGAYATQTMGGNLLGDLVQQEVRQRQRIVAIDDQAVLMAPYGARVPYQLMIAPRTPRPRFEDDGPTGAAILHDALRRLGRRFGSSPPLNLWVRTAPRGAEHFCWRIDILPRLEPLAGLELGAGVGLSVVAPEQAADELREA